MTRLLLRNLRELRDCQDILNFVRLPPRGRVGRIENVARVMMMAAANHKWRVARMPDDKRRRHEADCSTCKVKVKWCWAKAIT